MTDANPIYEDLPDGLTIRLIEPYRRVVWINWNWHERQHFADILVPAGFVSDLASVPWFFRRLIGQRGRFNRAALIHDWLYFTGRFDRETADKIFLKIMKEDGVCGWKRTAMYAAVRAGAWGVWNEHRARSRTETQRLIQAMKGKVQCAKHS